MKAIVCDGRNEIETVLGLYELDLSSNGGDGVVRKLGNIEKDEGMVRVYFMVGRLLLPSICKNFRIAGIFYSIINASCQEE